MSNAAVRNQAGNGFKSPKNFGQPAIVYPKQMFIIKSENVNYVHRLKDKYDKIIADAKKQFELEKQQNKHN